MINKPKETTHAIESDEELLKKMANRENEPFLANEAWGQFYERYKPYLWRLCNRKLAYTIEGTDLAKDIFSETMNTIYNNAEKFDIEKKTTTKAWIASIAQNEFYNYMKKNNRKNLSPIIGNPESSEDSEEFEETEENQLLNDAVAKLKSDQLLMLLGKLSTKKYKILMAYMEHQHSKGHLPDDIVKSLCEEFNVKAATLRQIKLRAIEELKKQAEKLL